MAFPTPGTSRPDDPSPTRIVGVGASAGGLAALEQFLSRVPPASGLAYVVVQHLDPTHKAMLAELLQRATTMPVREAAEALRVQPDTVYVIAPNTELTVTRGVLHAAFPAERRGLRLPIDVLFSSLARDLGERAIGVVLSGMGSDGTLGLQAIKTQGGLTLAQQPGSAEFDSMPSSAIAAGAADIVGVPADLPQRILQVVAGGREEATPPGCDGAHDAPALRSIIEQLHARSRHDLSLYKSSTLRRRIDRRLGVHGLASMAAYDTYVRENPEELDLLFKEMLIGVTGFFRDPAVWQDVKDTVLPELLADCPDGARLRAWVAGCSTGEEAYSLAMLFAEVCDATPGAGERTLQIFATDLSADAIALARKGVYPATIRTDVTAERMARFFSPHGEGFIVDKRIREMVLFAQHDVILDPPFTKLDMVCCRNLMIYFSAPLQRRLVPLFHYGLRPGGILLLGESETVGAAQSLFVPLRPKSRLYRRSEAPTDAVALDFPIRRHVSVRPSSLETRMMDPSLAPANLQSTADRVLLQEFSPPALLVNDRGDIVYISGRTGRYLEPAAGKANWNIHVMARPGIRTQIAAGLRQAQAQKQAIELRGLRLEDDAHHLLDVTIKLIQQPQALAGLSMIVFREILAPLAGKSQRKGSARGVDPSAGDELERALEEIRALRQEMRASEEELQSANEELQSTNEELQSTNEELQSANEELTTSKEEAQSMTEELQTINNELQSKLDDLALAQSDMQNLLNSTDIATLFLDRDLNVRRFTDKIARIVHLREGDIGRPLSDLATTLIYPELQADTKETLRTLAFCEKQIATTDGRWFSVRIMPYRTLANVIDGAVITFVDITTAKQLESRLRAI